MLRRSKANGSEHIFVLRSLSWILLAMSETNSNNKYGICLDPTNTIEIADESVHSERHREPTKKHCFLQIVQ